MAGLIAVVRLLWRLTRRDMTSLASLGLNNLFFCLLFLTLGGSAKQAFESTQLFQMVLLLPMLAAIAADTLERIPTVREKLWPISTADRFVIRTAGLAMSPAFWLIGGAMTLWGGAAAGIVYVLLALMIQILAFGWTFALRASSIEPLRVVPQIRGQLGGLAQISLRQMLSTLDCYAAMLLCLSGTAYRWLAHAPSAEAFPILSMLVAVALSTVAQQMFGWETAGSMARYRLLPLAGWRLLLAKDLSYLSITGLLCLPLNVGCGMTFSLVALSLGRWTSIRQPIAQKSWRFTRGNARFGAAQLLAGMLAGLGYARVGPWFLMGAAVLWMGSLYAGQAWWNRVCR